MSPRMVLMAVVAAVVLGAVTLLVVRGGGGSSSSAAGPAGLGQAGTLAPGDRVMDFDPTAVAWVRVRHGDVTDEARPVAPGDGPELTLAAGGGWVITTGVQPGAGGSEADAARRWPADAARLVALLREVAELRAEAVTSDSERADLGPVTASMAVGLRSGRGLLLEFGRAGLGGQELVAVTATEPGGQTAGRWTALVRAGLRDRLAPRLGAAGVAATGTPPATALRALRAGDVLSAAVQRGRGLAIELRTGAAGAAGQGGGVLRLESVGTAWRLSRPVEAPADGQAVAGLLTALSGVQTRRFYDDGFEGGPSGKVAPSADDGAMPRAGESWVAVEFDRPAGAAGATAPARQRVTLALGGPADGATRTRAARAVLGRELEPVIGVDTASLTPGLLEPTRFIARAAVAASSADVRTLGLAPLGASGAPGPEWTWARTTAGWTERAPAPPGGAGSERTLSAAGGGADEVDTAVRFLTAQPAADVALAPAPPGYRPVARAMLRGERLDQEVELGVLPLSNAAASGARPSVVIKVGDVYRRYDSLPPLFLRALGAEAWRAEAPGAPAQPEPGGK